MTALDDLIRLVPPPPAVPPASWDGVDLPGHAVPPADYRALVDAYGPGAFDGFFWVLLPRSTNRYLDLGYQTGAQLGAFRVLRDEGEEIPLELDDPATHAIPWAMTDNGDVVWWHRAPGAPPEAWTVVVTDSRGPFWDAYDGSATQFLYDVLSRRFTGTVFPDDFPSEAPAFQPRTQA